MKRARLETLPAERSAAEFLPDEITLPALQTAAKRCKGCELYKRATQVVFGEGAVAARMMFVGEQPGDQEDFAGRPFVGPAGRILDSALKEAGISRGDVYVTNAVKHFKWNPSGKRRLHAKPSAREIGACHPWLEAEMEAVSPRIVVCLGATAAQSLLGNDFRVTRDRGKVLESEWGSILATVHPSSILRAPDDDARHAAYAAFVKDLKVAARKSR
jgi:uracil-DNA glycosylase family protein